MISGSIRGAIARTPPAWRCIVWIVNISRDESRENKFMNDPKEILAKNAKARRLEHERCMAAVDAEPELPDAMTDELWEVLCNDREAMVYAMRSAVRLTKAGIKARIGGSNGIESATND